ncbi:hypothetical protein VOLCADRAFT_106214 [Volvox carteri f. nagariensis]|uniref:Uncharacterized protein n=1 Tax=Volvox carteri f. nagariensis TaxID=3068 RepID=D8U5V6_VOLCA|nr:uncharacterized protein VOLCADRAFT_106214 [Volvox carteri f. nagariensis]EFJ44823.1 hypothetical protein VOLCADRAFT_106214 [Volvox carteri f. nagariensis]|eukprot:XP_002954106.1 hypothetical protein VOLCADRAFT_106214 [Volvox carteri f. nagariensis]
MAVATLICRQANLVGATYDESSGSVLITVQGDGVQSHSLEQAKSCHFLTTYQIQHGSQQQQQAADASAQCLAAAVVLNDGRVGVTVVGPDGAAGPLHLPPSSPQPPPLHVLTTSSADTLLVVTQSTAGSQVTLRVLRLSPAPSNDATGLTQVKALTLPCPGGSSGAVPTSLTMSPAFALIQWSNGHATAVHGLQGGAAASPLRPCSFPLADAVLANGASSSSAPATATTPAAIASGRKRKSAAATLATDNGSAPRQRPRVLCAAVDERQFVVLDLESSAAQSQICFSLHDAQFGCPLSSGCMEVDAPLLSLDVSQCAVVSSGPEATLVRLGGAVHGLHIRTHPISLLSLVARLSMSASAASAGAPAAAKGTPVKLKSGGIGGAGVAKAVVTLPAQVSLDPTLLSGQPLGATPAVAAAAMGDDDFQDVVLEPVPGTAVNRVEDICNSLIEQLSSAAAADTPPSQSLLDSVVSYIAGRRQHGMAVPPQLLSLTARGLAAARQWSQLGSFLNHVPRGGLSGCSDVLVLAAAAQQFGLLSRLSTCLDDVEPGALVDALQVLLAPTTRSNLAARQQHYNALRAAAEARVAEAETAVRRATADAGNGSAVALAQCAAAAVDGFSYREVLLHPLLAIPVDAPAVQVALRRLSAPSTDALLGCLSKWLVKYTGGALGDLTHYVVLPQELLFPYYHQVLEWTRMTIDAHLTRLLMAKTPLPALESLEAALNKAVEGTRRLAMLRGALEHLSAAAPLPAAHIAVATQYTAEVLDLRGRKKRPGPQPPPAQGYRHLRTPRVRVARGGSGGGGGGDGSDGSDYDDRPSRSDLPAADIPVAKPYQPPYEKEAPPPPPPPAMGFPSTRQHRPYTPKSPLQTEPLNRTKVVVGLGQAVGPHSYFSLCVLTYLGQHSPRLSLRPLAQESTKSRLPAHLRRRTVPTDRCLNTSATPIPLLSLGHLRGCRYHHHNHPRVFCYPTQLPHAGSPTPGGGGMFLSGYPPPGGYVMQPPLQQPPQQPPQQQPPQQQLWPGWQQQQWQGPYQCLGGAGAYGPHNPAAAAGPSLGRLGAGGAGGAAVLGGLGGLAAGMLLGNALSGDDGGGAFDAFDGGGIFDF